MIKVLANDGLNNLAIEKLQKAGFEVLTEKVPQEQLEQEINEKNISVLLVRSATKVRKELIDACPHLKIIGRGGVGMDNIDVDYARKKGIEVMNTPLASSLSVAELVFGHIFSVARFIHDSNRRMPLDGDSQFGNLKKEFSAGTELRGKTIGIIGFGNIGQSVARISIGLGMNVLAFDIEEKEVEVELVPNSGLNAEGKIVAKIKTSDTPEDILKNSDVITVHAGLPKSGEAIVTKKWFDKMQPGTIFINAARGGVVKEEDMVEALNNKIIKGVGLDVFENEPKPSIRILMDQRISLTPHIGASTGEAQVRVGLELAEKVVSHFKS